MTDDGSEPVTFERELAQLINRYSRENGSHTPDFILADYLRDCLAAFDKASKRREDWYGRGDKLSGGSGPNPVGPRS